MRVGLIPITLRAGYQPKLSTEHRRVISATVGIALPIPLKFVPLCPPDGICFEAGWLRATQGKRRGHGSMMTFGAFWQLEDRIDRIGVRLQVQYSVMRRHDYVPHGLNANLIFH